MSKTVLALTGGLDSVTLAYYLKSKGTDIVGIFLDYGLPQSKMCKAAARHFAVRLGIPLEISNITGLGDMVRAHGFIAELDGGDSRDQGEHDLLDTGFLPNSDRRLTGFYNTLAPVSYLARILSIDSIALGVINDSCSKNVPVHNILDKWKLTMEAIDSIKATGESIPFDIQVPFIDMDKAEVIKIGDKLDVQFDATYSCLREGPIHCGECQSCTDRKEQFEKSGIKDPTWYEKKV